MPLITDIADAVVTELNIPASPTHGATVARRQYRPRKELKELKTLAVTVVPKAVAVSGATRGGQQVDVDIDVALQQKLTLPDEQMDAEVDPLMQMVESVIDFLARRRLSQLPGAGAGAAVIKVQNNPIYSVEHLDELRVFTSVITLTYRALK